MNRDAADRRQGLLWALSSAIGGAFMVIPWKRANEVGEPAHAALLLLLVAAIANSAFASAQRWRNGSSGGGIGRTDLAVAALLATFTLAGNLASARAIQQLSPALLNVLLRADVLFVALLGWPFLGERVEARFWLGAAVAVVGLGVLQGPAPLSGGQALLGSGTLMAIGAALCFSGLAVTTRRFIHEIDPVAVNAIRLWLAVGLWFPFYSATGLRSIPASQVLYAGVAALAGPFLGRLALMLSARTLEARVSTLATLTTPILTLLLAFLILSDWPADHELVGGAIMIAGIAIPLLSDRRRARRA